MGEARKKRDSLLSSRAAALVSCVSLDARARAFPSLNLKKKRDCSHSNPPAVFTAPRLVRPSKRLKEIDQIDHFCTRKALALKKRGRVYDPICENEFHLREN